MKKREELCRRLLSAATVCVLAVMSAGFPVMAEEEKKIDSAKAAVMQLMKTEGEVDISNSSGKDISIIPDMKLHNGYHAETEEASYAWINLDSEKLTKLDEVSEAEVRKKGKKLELLLESGNLFFNVTDKLDEDESMNVRTSTMVTGIRGTCGWAEVISKWHSRIYILEGTVQCCVTDPVTSQEKSIELNAGETAEFLVYPQDQEGDKCDIIMKKFTEEDIDGFVLAEAVQDEELCERIYEASGLDLLGMKEDAGKRLKDGEDEMRQIMDGIYAELENQENHISKDPVWERGDEWSGLPGTGGAGNGTVPGYGTNAGTGTGGAGNPGGTAAAPGGDAGTPAPVPDTVPGNTGNYKAEGPFELSDHWGIADYSEPDLNLVAGMYDINNADINGYLSMPNVPSLATYPLEWEGVNQNTVYIVTAVTIPAGKTFEIRDNGNMQVNSGQTITVDGVLKVSGNLINNGTINVGVAGSLEVGGRLTDNGTINR